MTPAGARREAVCQRPRECTAETPSGDLRLRGSPAQGEAWGLRTSLVAELLAPGEAANFTAYPATATQQDNLPFDAFLDGPQPEYGTVLVGLVWKRSDGTPDKLVEVRPVGPVGPNDIERFKTS